MKKTLLVAFASLLIISTVKSQSIKSPGEFLGYETGTQFTYQYRAVDYFRYIASVSPMAKYREYGVTNEGRTLGVCFVSSEENLANLEEYRKNNLIKAGFSKGEFTGKQIPFIWLAYNVHGNEAVGMEAAMKTLYTLVSCAYPNVSDYLKECIIVIDPCQNPDGHDLYTNRYRSTMNSILTPDGKSWEHNQGWPGARTNHYLFDLNRDWIWQTQAETQQRVILYNQFMPQVHADFHEMGVESTFYFAPGSDPWNTVITPWQHEFHKLMGDGTASLFNEKFRLYFTKENFDLFYPGYGDTWPILNGAIGFTFEQGGGGPSGLAYKLESGDTLTLKDRIDGHFTASMAVIKVSCENREKLVTEYNKFFDESVKNPNFQYKSVIIKGSNEKSIISSLLNIFDRNQIRYSYAGNTGKKFKGFDYQTNKDGEVTIEKGDILLSAYQPQSHLMQALFEPVSKTTDSISYDITAWSLPYVYNLKALATAEKIAADTTRMIAAKIINEVSTFKPYAYVANFTGFYELKFIAALFNKKVKLRYSLKPFVLNGSTFNRGSIIVARGDNKDNETEFDKIVTATANECQVKLMPAQTGLVESGKDFGSENTPLVKQKSVALICGEGTLSGSVGEIWYFFEKELNYPLTLINPATTQNFDLKDYDVLILTSGKYSKLKDTIIDYTKRGGRVIAIENAISLFAGEKTTSLSKAIEARTAEQKLTEKKVKSDDSTLLKKFETENDKRYDISEHSEGSIYKVKLDDTDPYVFGMGKEWYIMKRSPGYPFLTTGSNIGYIVNKEPVAGFAGFKYKDKIKNTLVIGAEKIGSGEVIYITDDPYFRAFWKSGRILLGNAILR
jgi:Zinc carboxypeptidase